MKAAFDMDGTLSESRQPISDEMIECLEKIPNFTRNTWSQALIWLKLRNKYP